MVIKEGTFTQAQTSTNRSVMGWWQNDVGEAVLIASAYGWPSPSAAQAQATSDIIREVLLEARTRGNSRAVLLGDLNCDINNLPVAMDLSRYGWGDPSCEVTCRPTACSQGTKIDYAARLGSLHAQAP